jgi:Metal binding domain of Ada
VYEDSVNKVKVAGRLPALLLDTECSHYNKLRMAEHKLYKLTGSDGKVYSSGTKGVFGGHRLTRGYGRMDCPAALRAIARVGYVRHRVFFANEATAIDAGYRPCAVCLPERYALWKQACVIAGVPPTVQSRARRQPALDRYRDLLRL